MPWNTMKTCGFLVLHFAIVLATNGRFGSYDPYAIDDANDKYPQHHCELNEDEFGRPYLGSYDRFLSPQWPYLLVVPSPLSFSAVPVLDQLFSAGAGGFQTLTQCITSNECNPNYERCSGKGTVYDRCGRRCTCDKGLLTNCCRVRKEWRSMSQAERCLYTKTLKTASTNPRWKRCYDELIMRHETLFESGIHNQTYFLPWHRWYILSLENLLRKIDCRVTVPYWDWSLESQTWMNSTVWEDLCGLGGDGDPANNGSVMSGLFKQPEGQAPNGQLLTRKFNGTLPSCAQVALTQRMHLADFCTWHNCIESYLHKMVHCSIGGQMCSYKSANDPVFFLHHGFIDKLWSDWQNNGPAFKNLSYYTQNTNPMPGSEGASPADMYDLQKQPGCVRVCLEQPSRPCIINTTYAPMCVQEMIQLTFSPLKLANVVQRPCPRVSQKAFDLYGDTVEERMLSNRYAELLSDYDTLVDVLRSNGYDTTASCRLQSGFIDFGIYLYKSMERCLGQN